MLRTNGVEIDGFIRGLQAAKNIYAQCPNCDYIFSLYNARLMHGKAPPKDFLAESEKQVKKAMQELEVLQEQYENDKQEWEMKVSDLDLRWRTKADLQLQEFINKRRLLQEQLRHIKSDIAAAHKEIIQEKVERAIRSSRSAIEGHIAELFPVFRKTQINPADLCSLVPTQPIDFVVFNGLFQKEVKSVTFIDVKKGSAGLSYVQQSIRDCIHDGKVDFKKIRVSFDEVKGQAQIES